MHSTYLLKTARDKLPMALKVKWSEFVVDNNLNNPGLFELQQWMEKQSRASELLQESEPITNFGSSSKKFPNNYNVNNNNKHKTSNQATSEPYAYQSSSQQNGPKKVHKCPIDEEEHYVGKCPKFLAMTVAERIDEIKKQGLCFNCLSDDHTSKDCQSKSTCRECKGKHHTLIHENKRFQKTNALTHAVPRRFHGQDWQPKLATNAGIGFNGHFKNRQHIKKTHPPQSIFGTTFWRSRGETRSDSRTRSSQLQLDSRTRSSKLQLKDWTTRGIAPFRRFTRTFTGPDKH